MRKKKWIRVSNNNGETEATMETVDPVETETKEDEEKMSFFKRHKKGLIFGGVGLAAGIAGLIALARKGSDDDEDEEIEDLYDDFEEDDEIEDDAEGDSANEN